MGKSPASRRILAAVLAVAGAVVPPTLFYLAERKIHGESYLAWEAGVGFYVLLACVALCLVLEGAALILGYSARRLLLGKIAVVVSLVVLAVAALFLVLLVSSLLVW